MSYRNRYLTALALLLPALLAFLLQWWWEEPVHGGAGLCIYLCAGLFVLVWLGIAIRRGLLLLKSAQPDFWLYHATLALTLGLAAVLCMQHIFCLENPTDISAELSRKWDQRVKEMQDQRQGVRNAQKGMQEAEQGWVPKVGAMFKAASDMFWGILSLLWGYFLLLVQVALIVVVVLLILALLPVLLLVFWAMIAADLKSGIVLILGALLLLVAGGGAAVAPDMPAYAAFGALLLVASLAFATNWGGLRLNGDISDMHPAFYDTMTTLGRRPLVTKSTLYDALENAYRLQQNGEALPVLLRDAMESRLLKEQLVIPEDANTYRVGLRKRLKLRDGLLAMLALTYLTYPSLGVFELVPDNLPLIGNLDEAFMIWLLATYIYPRWKADRQEVRQGSICGDTQGPTSQLGLPPVCPPTTTGGLADPPVSQPPGPA